MKRLKVYGGMLALVAALSASPFTTMHTFAEEAEEETYELETIDEQEEQQTEQQTEQQSQEEQQQDAQQSQEEEIVYVETNGNFQLSDIQTEGQGQQQGQGQESQGQGQQQGQGQGQQQGQESQGQQQGQQQGQGQENQGVEGSEGYEEAFNPNNTKIDKDDEKYNTGRTEIPNTVLTEAERKNIDKLKTDEPGKEEEKETPGTEQTTETTETTQTTETTEQTTPNPTPVPKMGISYKAVYAIGAALGLIGVGAAGIKYQNSMDNLGTRVISSRRKYRKRRSKRK